MVGHHLIFFTLSNSIWTRLLVSSGEGVEAQSTGLQKPPIILSISGCGNRW
jgi:hypothetical protein